MPLPLRPSRAVAGPVPAPKSWLFSARSNQTGKGRPSVEMAPVLRDFRLTSHRLHPRLQADLSRGGRPGRPPRAELAVLSQVSARGARGSCRRRWAFRKTGDAPVPRGPSRPVHLVGCVRLKRAGHRPATGWANLAPHPTCVPRHVTPLHRGPRSCELRSGDFLSLVCRGPLQDARLRTRQGSATERR